MIYHELSVWMIHCIEVRFRICLSMSMTILLRNSQAISLNASFTENIGWGTLIFPYIFHHLNFYTWNWFNSIEKRAEANYGSAPWVMRPQGNAIKAASTERVLIFSHFSFINHGSRVLRAKALHFCSAVVITLRFNHKRTHRTKYLDFVFVLFDLKKK